MMSERQFHEDLNLNPYELVIVKSIAAGLTLKEIAVTLDKTRGDINTKMHYIREKNKFPTTEKLMYWLGRSGQLDGSKFKYEFPIGV